MMVVIPDDGFDNVSVETKVEDHSYELISMMTSPSYVSKEFQRGRRK